MAQLGPGIWETWYWLRQMSRATYNFEGRNYCFCLVRVRWLKTAYGQTCVQVRPTRFAFF